jgi:hypothetical protein
MAKRIAEKAIAEPMRRVVQSTNDAKKSMKTFALLKKGLLVYKRSIAEPLLIFKKGSRLSRRVGLSWNFWIQKTFTGRKIQIINALIGLT